MSNQHQIYDGKVNLQFDPQKHIYIVDGEVYKGVTSTFNYAPSKNLTFWAAGEATKYVKDKWKPNRAYDEVYIADVLRAAPKAHLEKRDKSADMGTMVHEWAEAYARGQKPEHPQNPQLNRATKKLEEFFKKNNVQPELIERPLASIKYKLAGTPDLIGTFNGKRAIIDWKTGKGIYETYPLQLGAYSMMYHEEFGERPELLVVVSATVRSDALPQAWISQLPVEYYEQGYMQCFGVRGYVTDIKSELNKHTFYL
jgi:hypothetical protein